MVASTSAVLALYACARPVGSNAISSDPLLSLPNVQPRAAAQLLFISETYYANHGFGDVLLFDYPSGRYVGTLPAPPEGFNGPGDECKDRAGNVYFVNESASKIDEYTGQGSYIRSVTDGQTAPIECSISSSTGDLAVVNDNSSGAPSSISIFRNARGSPKVISSPYFYTMTYLSYDGAGNVFFDGSQGPVGTDEYGEIPKGASAIQKVKLSKNIYPERLQFDGAHVAIGSLHKHLYQAKGRYIERSITLQDGVTPFFIAGDRILTLNGPKKNHYTVQVYSYPSGGAPLQTIELQYYFRSRSAGAITLSH
jgi:hypothetical protein